MAQLHLIGNAHLDPVWLWRWQEGFSEIISTFRSALDRMNDFPDFKFTSACAAYYQWVEKIDPEMFDEIAQRVKEGRWNIVGGWFIQPDCNLPDGESFARHALISQRYFQEKFGVTAKTGYNVDSFGHNASLPQILKLSGMDNYVFMRPSPSEKDIKTPLFRWESDDGSRVCTFRINDPYCIMNEHGFDVMRKTKEAADRDNTPYMSFYGVGNHGGGPTISLINHINQMNIPEAVHSTPDAYFALIDRDQLPVIHDELQHHARGCYSAMAAVKAGNRRCEANLLTAEKLCTMAKRLTGFDYPAKRLKKAWKNLLFNQFHDILGGCSIKSAFEDAGYLYGEIMSITDQAIMAAMQKICRSIDTLQGETLPSTKDPKNWRLWEHEVLGTPIAVFNPHTWPVRTAVQLTPRTVKMTDNHGAEIPFQKVRAEQTNGPDKHGTAFIAEVPALGYRVYRLFGEDDNATVTEFENTLTAGGRLLENSEIRVEFDTRTGDICSFYDKKADKHIVCKPCKAILLDETECDTWAHDWPQKHDYLGETVAEFDRAEFSVIEQGPVRATLRVKTYSGNSSLTRDYTIVAGSNVITVRTTVDFREKHRTLKLAFPVNGGEVTAKIPYGTVTRPFGTGEEPCGDWIAAGGLCIANDSKYAYDTLDNQVRMTVLRSAVYADHYGQNERDALCEYMEQGIHTFSYSLFPYSGKADANRHAAELNAPVRVLTDSFHGGALPEEMSCFACDRDNIIVTAIKQSEDGNCDVVRFYEAEGTDGDVSIRLFDDEISAKLTHNQIKTLKTTGEEVNLLEW